MKPDAFLLLAVQLFFASILMWCCFCRLVRTDHETHPHVRWAIVMELAAAGLVAGGPFAPYLMPADATWTPLTTPTILWVLLLFSVALVHVVTAKAWADTTALKRSPGPGPRWTVTLGVAAVIAAVFVFSPTTRAQAQELFYRVDKGKTLTCAAAAGCVGMSIDTFRELAKVVESAATGCRRGVGSV